MLVILTIIAFLIGVVLLVKGADLFVAGGSGLAIRHSISPALIGFTIIAFGTSLPELVVSVNAAATGNTGITLGNVLGSNIANIALILALCTFIRPDIFAGSVRSRRTVNRHTFLMLAATAVFALLAVPGTLDARAGALMLLLFVFILVLLWRERQEEPGTRIQTHGRRDALFIALGLAAVVIGSQLVITNAITIADAFGIPAFVVGLTMVAVGTSLPELATSLVAIIRGEGAISVGNILGSNIFNLLLVLGISLLLAPVAIGSMVDVLIVVAFSAAILPLLFAPPSFVRAWSGLLLISYAAYITWLFSAAPPV
jgi:cation:H+ antiporter